ncbi:MAG: hypothetical protein Q7J45_00395 [bacterium]|nr:hypothetical protein [bacterium]
MSATESLVPKVVGVSIQKVVSVGRIEEQRISSCFAEYPFVMRSGLFFQNFNGVQPATEDCSIVVVKLDRDLRLVTLMTMLFGVNEDIPIPIMRDWLIARRHIITAPQLEAVILGDKELAQCNCKGFVMCGEGQVLLLSINQNGETAGDKPQSKSVFSHLMYNNQCFSADTYLFMPNFDPPKSLLGDE